MTIPIDRVRVSRDRTADARELVSLRSYFNLSLEQMAVTLDVSQSTLRRWESGEIECPLMALYLLRCWKADVERSGDGKKRTAPRGSKKRGA